MDRNSDVCMAKSSKEEEKKQTHSMNNSICHKWQRVQYSQESMVLGGSTVGRHCNQEH